MQNGANDLAGLLLERCESLGVGACVLTPEGRLTATTSRPRSLGTLLRTARALQVLRGAGHESANITELTPGLCVVVVPYENARGERGRLAGLAPSPDFANSPEFAELCRQASVDPRAARADLATISRHDERSRHVLRVMLEATVRDALAVHERDEALGSFTTQLTESYDTIDLLYSIGRSMHGPFDGPGFVGMVCDRLQKTLSFSWVGAFFTDAACTPSRLRNLAVVRGSPPRADAELAAGIRAVLAAHCEFPLVTNDDRCLGSMEHPQVAVQHLTCKGETCGLLVLGGKGGIDPFVSSYDTQLMEAAGGFLSAFTDNVALYDAQVALFMGTVGALTAAIDAKDRYTFGHSERVAWMARELALASGLSREQAERVHIAGLVHDVGKIGVPEAVLCKPGKLSDDEFALIKQHPVIGHRILKDIPGLADILPGVLYHHERIDGRGYPSRLAGDDIPQIARIIAVADTFDAMSSSRSYRTAMPREKVLAEIVRSAGSQLDTRIAMLVGQLDLRGFDALHEHHAIPTAIAA